MQKARFTEKQIAFVLKQVEQEASVAEACRKMGITEQSFYRWKKKYTGMMPSDIKCLKQLEEENAKLKIACRCTEFGQAYFAGCTYKKVLRHVHRKEMATYLQQGIR